jgi:hypothetical protein
MIDIWDSALKALTWIGVILMPIKATMLSIGVLLVFDLITGIWAAYKRGEKITSNGIRRTVSKSLAYQMAVISSFIMESQFLEGLPIIKVVAGLIAATEFKSLMENITSITGLDFIAEIIGKIQGKKIVPELKTPKEVIVEKLDSSTPSESSPDKK